MGEAIGGEPITQGEHLKRKEKSSKGGILIVYHSNNSEEELVKDI